jgi:hypothetical protein
LSEPQESITVSPEANEPTTSTTAVSFATSSNTIPTPPEKTIPKRSTSNKSSIKKNTFRETKKKSTTEIPLATSKKDQSRKPSLETNIYDTSLAPPVTTFPSSRPHTPDSKSSKSSYWTQNLQKQINQGTYFGTPPTEYSSATSSSSTTQTFKQKYKEQIPS